MYNINVRYIHIIYIYYIVYTYHIHILYSDTTYDIIPIMDYNIHSII